MALLIPAAQTDINSLKVLRDSTISKCNKAVEATTSQSLIFRDLTPQDLTPGTGGLTTARFSNPNAMVSETPINLFNYNLLNMQAIGIYGYAAIAANPQIDQITFSVGSAAVLAQYFLDSIYADQTQTTGYFEPIIWTPQQNLVISGLAGAAVAANGETFVLLGIVVEPEGRTVQPVPVA